MRLIVQCDFQYTGFFFLFFFNLFYFLMMHFWTDATKTPVRLIVQNSTVISYFKDTALLRSQCGMKISWNWGCWE